MALRNPTINPPRLPPSPTKRSLQSRSPSRSPIRHHARDFDPLLRDLSPTATLRAFSTAPRGESSPTRLLAKSVEGVSRWERALGAKAAQGCADFRAWAREMEGWEWSGTFETPEPARKRQRMSGLSILSDSKFSLDQSREADEEEYWGSLPSETVEAYEQRAEEIRQDLDEVDVEELKEFVLSAHSRASTAPVDIDDSIGTIGAATDLKRLDDFTALVTATIFQALPWLSRLHRLLHSWAIRLYILRSAPSYLTDLRRARTDLNHGWAALAVSPSLTAARGQDSRANFTRETMIEMKDLIENQVYGLGRRLDRFLDELEGRVETVPEAWIEDFEMLEVQYGEWAVQAERKVLEDEWRAQATQGEAKSHGQFLAVDRMPSATRSESKMSIADEDPEADKDAVAGSTPMAELDGEGILVAGGVGAKKRIDSTMGLEEAPSTRHAFDADGENSRPTTARRSRHVPITYNFEEYSQILTDSEHENSESPAQTPHPDLTKDPDTTPKKPEAQVAAPSSSQKVKKRAAFLNGDFEKISGLKKGKPPPIVRPFEHASNAFTRLFKRESKTPEQQSRSNSVKSANSDLKASAGSKRAKTVYGDGVGGTFLDTKDVGTASQLTGKIIGDAASSSTGTGSSGAGSGAKRQSTSSWTTKNEKYAPDVRDSRRLDLNRNTYLDMVGPPAEARRSEDFGRSRSRSVRSGNPKKSVSKDPPETYRPTGLLSSPFHSPYISADAQPGAEFPEDWPLSSAGTTPMDTASPTKEKEMGRMGGILGTMTSEKEEDEDHSGPETGEPQQAIASDAFDRMFVQTFPAAGKGASANEGVRKERPQTVAKAEGIAAAEETIRRLQRERDYAEERAGIADRVAGEVLAKRMEILDMALPRPVSTVVEEEREIAPESSWFDHGVNDEDPAGYAALNASQGLARASSSSAAAETTTAKPGLPSRSKSMPPVSPMMLKLMIPSLDSHEDDAPTSGQVAEATRVTLIKRASVTSIESHPRSELRSIDVPRRSSMSSLGSGVRSAPQTPRDSAPVSAVSPRDSAPPSAVESKLREAPTSPMEFKGTVVLSSPPSVPPRRSSLQGSPHSSVSPEESREGSPTAARHLHAGSSPLPKRDAGTSWLDTDDYDVAAAPLNRTMSKRKYKDVPRDRLKEKVSSPPPKAQTPLRPGEDNFDRHVSEVLDRVHAPIRFKTRPGDDTPLPSQTNQRPAGPKSTKSMPGKPAERMILAPADPSPKKAMAAEADVKLYHLTQAGKSEPIKLFVRLVGEGERVMVRVGGGWADLADYLRQYAEHHGSRTVSDGALEVQTLSTTTPSAPNGPGSASVRRTFSGPAAEPKSVRTPITPLAAYKGPVDANWLRQAQPRFTMGDSSPSDTEASPIDGLPQTQTQAQRSAPKSVTSSKSGSRPSTADASRPYSRQGGGPRLDTEAGSGFAGLAGPLSAKGKAELPEQKARWVEGMIERVNKSASAEKSREEREKYFGDIGKVGGTRRVVFRSNSGMGGEK